MPPSQKVGGSHPLCPPPFATPLPPHTPLVVKIRLPTLCQCYLQHFSHGGLFSAHHNGPLVEGGEEGGVDAEEPPSLPDHVGVGGLFHFLFGGAKTTEGGTEEGRGREGGEGGREGRRGREGGREGEGEGEGGREREGGDGEGEGGRRGKEEREREGGEGGRGRGRERDGIVE